MLCLLSSPKLRKSHLTLLHVLILQEVPELQPCTDEHHNKYTETYMPEYDYRFCNNSWLEGQQCAECKKRFVLDKQGEGECTPSGKTPLWFCQCCKIREVQRRGGNSGKVPGVIHCFCDSCYKPKLSECAKNTPRGKRSITAVQKNVDSSCLDPVRKELLPAEYSRG